MKPSLKLSSVALALAISLGSALAQSSAPAQSSGTGGAGTSATGGRSAPAAQAGTGTRQSETNKDDKLARGDRRFVLEAAGSGMFEVQAAQLATTKASDPAVKSFAGMLIDHHTKANDELTKLANAKGVELPAAPPRAMRRQIEQMGKKQGQEFDQEFVRNIGVKAHEKDVKLFQQASKELKDAELKAFAAKTLPQLQEHLQMAQKMPQSGKDGSDQARKGGTGQMGASGSQGGGASSGGAAKSSGAGAGSQGGATTR